MIMMRKEKVADYYELKTKKQEILVIDEGSCAKMCCPGPTMLIR